MRRFPVIHKLTSTTAQQVANQMKLVFSEYGWPETIVYDNGPCYSAETFTKLMTDYSVNHITSSPHYPQSNSLAEKYVQIVKNLFYKAQEERTDYCKSLMIAARTLLPMSNVARTQHGLGSEQLRVTSKNEQLPTHNLHISQSVMHLNPVNRIWYPATVTQFFAKNLEVTISEQKMVSYIGKHWTIWNHTNDNTMKKKWATGTHGH